MMFERLLTHNTDSRSLLTGFYWNVIHPTHTHHAHKHILPLNQAYYWLYLIYFSFFLLFFPDWIGLDEVYTGYTTFFILKLFVREFYTFPGM